MASHGKETHFAEYHYYKINRILLSILKLWPYHRTRFAIINHIINLTLLVSFIVFQLTSFLTYQYTLDFLVLILSYVVPSASSIVIYCSFCANPNAIKKIWKDINGVWSILKNGAEREIMHKYSYSGKLYTTTLLLLMVMCLTTYTLIQFVPDILDLVSPLNETRPHYPYAITEYFIDKNIYFYPLLAHWLIGISANLFVVITVATLHMIYIEHICGMLSVACYRIEHSIDQYISCKLTKEEDRAISRNIGDAVYIHRKALKCSTFTINTFSTYFFIILAFTVLALSLNFLRLLNEITGQKRINEVFAPTGLIFMHIIIIFLTCYYGQKITDHNNQVFYYAYNTKWYAIPAKVQKLFLFIMKRTTKAYVINIANMIAALMEGFSKVMSVSISYFTVMYSLQQ